MLCARTASTIAFSAALLLTAVSAAAHAEPSHSVSPPVTATAQPYAPVAVKISAPPADPSFAAFRAELAAVAGRRIYAELARLVVARQFFWERDFGGGYDRTKSGVDNLAVAIGLERGAGGGWATLAAFAAEPTARPIAARLGVICGPAQPQFDQPDFGALLDRTRTDGIDWVYPRAGGVAVRTRTDVNAPVIETLGMHFVRLLGFEAKASERDRARTAWARIAGPSGKIGFVAPDLLASPYAERLCYAKDVTGRWRIAGYVGGGD